PVTLSNLPGGTPGGTSTLLRDGSWGSDGAILFGALSSGLFRVSAAGGIPTALTTLDGSHGETSHRYPQVLPGGRVLFTITGNTPETSGTYATSVSNPTQ